MRDAVEGNLIAGNALDGIAISNSDNNFVGGNLVGTDVTGNAVLPNDLNGIFLNLDAGGNVIGGSPRLRNVIAANATSTGIAIDGGGVGNWIASNYVGLGADGSTPLGSYKGITVNNTHGQIIGTNSDGAGDGQEGNVVSGNDQRGIETAGNSEQNVIAGNLIGTGPDGLTRVGSQSYGVTLAGNSKNNVVGTNGDGQSDIFERNVIAGNSGNEVSIQGVGVTGNRVAGNYIGLGIDGTTLVLNGDRGVTIESGASGNIIGTNGDGLGDSIEGNVIGGMTQMGVRITASDDNIVAGNLIGTDKTGLLARPNNIGVVIENGAAGNVVGTNGDGAGDTVERNVISGNTNYGISIRAAGNAVAGNLIGTDRTGAAALPNNASGILIETGVSNTRIGTNNDGTSDGSERNVVSGNANDGIFVLEASENNVIAGNFIGTDITGTIAVGNAASGVRINDSAATIVGGSSVRQRNVISGNDVQGLALDNSVVTVANNHIGADVSGTVLLGNGTYGVLVLGDQGVTTIGGVGQGNVIGGNTIGIQTPSLAPGKSVLIQGNWIGTDMSAQSRSGQRDGRDPRG